VNHRPLRIPAILALASLSLIAAACGAPAVGPAGTPPTSTPQWNVMEEFEPTQTPPAAKPPVEPSGTPAPDQPAVSPAESSRVLWMRTSHAGPGVVTLRFETNVPTTATVMAMTHQVGPAHFFSEQLDIPGTHHATSLPASPFGRYQVRVEDEAGNVARAELRFKSDPQGIDWATGGAAPALKAPSAKQLDVTYAFPAGHPSKLGLDGNVYVFMTDESCTTADACEGELVGAALDAPAAGDAQLETHKAIAVIPGGAFDYQVVVGQPLNTAASMMIFLELEIRGDDLPAVNFGGPAVIKH